MILVARVARSCEILVKNRLEPARPAGWPRANQGKGLRFWPLFLKCEKWTFPELIPSSFVATRAFRGAFSFLRVFGAPCYLYLPQLCALWSLLNEYTPSGGDESKRTPEECTRSVSELQNIQSKFNGWGWLKCLPRKQEKRARLSKTDGPKSHVCYGIHTRSAGRPRIFFSSRRRHTR